MVFHAHTYGVLLVSSAAKFNSALSALLPLTDYWPLCAVGSAGEARRALLERSYDIVIVNAPLSDESGIRLAVDVCSGSGSCAVLFVKSELYAGVSAEVLEHGVLTMVKPTSESAILHSLRALCAARERIRRLEQRQVTVEEKIAEIRLVNHAKWLLIQHQGMTEAEAHRHIEKQAMDARIPRQTVAERIIHIYESSKTDPGGRNYEQFT